MFVSKRVQFTHLQYSDHTYFIKCVGPKMPLANNVCNEDIHGIPHHEIMFWLSALGQAGGSDLQDVL